MISKHIKISNKNYIGQLEKAECIFLYFTCSDSTFSGRANTAHVTASSQPGDY